VNFAKVGFLLKLTLNGKSKGDRYQQVCGLD